MPLSLPALLWTLFQQNAEMAAILAAEPGFVDLMQRERLAKCALANAQLFQQFVGSYIIEVERRPGVPLPAAVCPHCHR